MTQSPPKPRYRNKKNGKVYIVLDIGKACTNSRNGEVIVHYVPLANLEPHCYREQAEFNEKFDEVPV